MDPWMERQHHTITCTREPPEGPETPPAWRGSSMVCTTEFKNNRPNNSSNGIYYTEGSTSDKSPETQIPWSPTTGPQFKALNVAAKQGQERKGCDDSVRTKL